MWVKNFSKESKDVGDKKLKAGESMECSDIHAQRAKAAYGAAIGPSDDKKPDPISKPVPEATEETSDNKSMQNRTSLQSRKTSRRR